MFTTQIPTRSRTYSHPPFVFFKLRQCYLGRLQVIPLVLWLQKFKRGSALPFQPHVNITYLAHILAQVKVYTKKINVLYVFMLHTQTLEFYWKIRISHLRNSDDWALRECDGEVRRDLSHPVSGINIPALPSSTLQSIASAKMNLSWSLIFCGTLFLRMPGNYSKGTSKKTRGNATTEASSAFLKPRLNSDCERQFERLWAWGNLSAWPEIFKLLPVELGLGGGDGGVGASIYFP